MHVISEIKSNGVTHISEDWPDWMAIIDDLKTLRELGYTVYGTKINFRFVIVLVNAPLRPVLSCV